MFIKALIASMNLLVKFQWFFSSSPDENISKLLSIRATAQLHLVRSTVTILAVLATRDLE